MIMYCTWCDVYQLQEQTKHYEEQAKEMKEKTEQLTGEVASLRETLEKILATEWTYNNCAMKLIATGNVCFFQTGGLVHIKRHYGY